MIAYSQKFLFLFVIIISLVPAGLFAQYRGGNDDGTSYRLASNQPLGRNIYLGGNDDGTNVSLAGNLPLGRNIFLGGINDGTHFSPAGNQPLGRNIFTGGNDDGSSFSLVSSQPLGRNIFTGGVDDGTNFSGASNQPLGRNIFTGGIDDGWAMAFASIKEPLPLTLRDFTGRWQQNDAMLFWQTATELNTSHFELERSYDGSSYTMIQRVNAAGQSTSNRNYQYRDVNIKRLLPATIHTIYYRLRSVDKNGAATYSGIVVLKVSNTNEMEYAVYPNPAKDFITITASQLPAVENAVIRLADISGKVLLLQKMVSSRQQISVSAFPAGTYFLQLITGDKVVYTQKIIITK